MYYSMRRDIDTVEIKEPPLQELNKKRSCLKRSCLTGCGCILIFLIACLIILKIASSPTTKELKTLPPTISNTVPIYDEKNIDSILFTSGADRGKAIELAAYVPKLVLMPFIVVLEQRYRAPDAILSLIQEPVADHRDLYSITWKNLDAGPKFVQDFYRGELTKRGYTLETSTETSEIKQFTFKNTKDIEGAIYIKDIPDKNGTDTVVLSLQMPTTK